MDTKRTALITGASAGIGKAFAEVFAGKGFNLVLTARREDRLQAIQKQLHEKYGVTVTLIPVDLHDPEAPQRLFDRIHSEGLVIDALVNNAGYGVPGYFHNTSWDKQANFIQVLITVVAQLSHLFLPGMIERGYGRIINVSSLNGVLPGSPGQTLYSGAKAFVIQFSQTLFLETEGTGVNVTAICPGFTYSEFHDVTGMREAVSKKPSIMWMDAETVARQGYEAVMEGKHLLVNGRTNRFIALLAKLLPNKMGLRLVAKSTKDMRPVESV
ncbi:SDR family oxidoreductase [bacterium]|nr:SDR family oxidoreductase [bacterium]